MNNINTFEYFKVTQQSRCLNPNTNKNVLRQLLLDKWKKSSIAGDVYKSDGYNVYMYLDNEIIYTEHLCCMAHARPKFKYASEQGGNMDANYFLDCIVGAIQIGS